jgi:hypothetical protein
MMRRFPEPLSVAASSSALAAPAKSASPAAEVAAQVSKSRRSMAITPKKEKLKNPSSAAGRSNASSIP